MLKISARYDFGGDEFVFVEVNQEMDLLDNFRVMAITNKLKDLQITGIVEICPSNVSYLIRSDPNVIHPQDVINMLQDVTEDLPDVREAEFTSRIVEVPVYYDDPWTKEVLMKFRERHQDPSGTDLDYAAKSNGFNSVEDFIHAHSDAPYWVSMIGFVPGLPWCYQMVPRERQIEVPKYVRPRTDTLERSVGHGGAFACIYPVRGAGGYQIFGITPTPIFDQDQKLADFKENMVLLRPGDILKFEQISQSQYESIRTEVESLTYRYKTGQLTFSPNDVLANPLLFSEEVVRRLRK